MITHGARAPPCLLPETIAPWCRGKGHVATREEQKRHFAFKHHLSDLIFFVLQLCQLGHKNKDHFRISTWLSSCPSFGTLTPPHSFSLMFSLVFCISTHKEENFKSSRETQEPYLLISMMGFSTPTWIKTRYSTHASTQASTELQPSSKLTLLDASVFDENNP